MMKHTSQIFATKEPLKYFASLRFRLTLVLVLQNAKAGQFRPAFVNRAVSTVCFLTADYKRSLFTPVTA
jgi:hypothetical protein